MDEPRQSGRVSVTQHILDSSSLQLFQEASMKPVGNCLDRALWEKGVCTLPHI